MPPESSPEQVNHQLTNGSPTASIYRVGGSLPVDAPTYVERSADRDLFDRLMRGECCYVFNSRQMGKSSLRVRVIQRLEQNGVACGTIDPQTIGTQLDSAQWYASVISSLVESFSLEDRFDLDSWWESKSLLTPVKRLRDFLLQVLLVEVEQPIVIFVEEIDSLLNLGFSADDFFLLIRSIYDQRSEVPSYNRLAFALVGVTTPRDLIKGHGQHSAFNIGVAIEMNGFQETEVEPLALGLRGKVEEPEAVIREVLRWTGGQPFLTQKLLSLVVAAGQRSGSQSLGEWVGQIAWSKIIHNWETQDVPQHLKTLQDRILRFDEKILGYLLGIYQQVLDSDSVGIDADESYEQMQLRLTGLVVQRDGRLIPYNPIYSAIFNSGWVKQELFKLRQPFYAEIFEKWQKAGEEEKREFLLEGEALEEAEAWAGDRQLSYMDALFLRESQELRLETARKAQEAAEVKLAKTEKKTKKITRLGSIFLAGVLTISGIAGIEAIKSITELNNNLQDVWAISDGEFNRQQKKYDEAIKILDEIIEKNPRNTFALVSRGFTYNDKKDYAKAEAEFRAAIKIDNRYAIAYRNLGNALNNQKKLDEAIIAYKKAIEIDPKDAVAYNNLGIILSEQKKLDEAIIAYKKAIEIDPKKYAATYTNLGIILSDQKKLDEAIIAHKKAIEIDPKYAAAYNNLGNALREQKKLDEAIAAYKKAIEIDSKDAGAYNNLGNILREQKKLDEAITSYRKAIEIDSKFTPAYINLGNILREQKKLDEAITSYRKAIEIDSKFTPAYINLGNALIEQKKLDEAIAAYKKAIEIDPKDADVYNQFCLIGSIVGKAQEILSDCEKATELTSPSKKGYSQNNRGIARAITGNVAGAIEDFKAYLQWLDSSTFTDADKDKYRAKRQQWIDELREGKPPSEIFTKEVLEELINE